MPRLTQEDAEILVFTYKEGLLSRVAHDLKLRVGAFSAELDLEAGEIRVDVDPASLRVIAAQRDGADAPELLSAKDHQTIEDAIRNDVLHTRRYPQLRFEASEVEDNGDGTWEIEGELTLHGVARPARGTALLQGGELVVEVGLHQPTWGIKPYAAMLGALKVKADVVVRASVPAASVGL